MDNTEDNLRQENIKALQAQVHSNKITDLTTLKAWCKSTSLDIDPYEDVLLPMGWNTCERCGALCDADLDLLWVDSCEWETDGWGDDSKDQALLNALGEEPYDYCAICYKCVKELTKKGERSKK